MFIKEKRYTAQELSLIESTFKDQTQLLVSIRKFILQGEMLPDELNFVRSFTSKPEVVAVIRKTLCPDLDKGAPIMGTVDMFTAMDLTPTPVEHANLAIKTRKLARRFLNERLDDLGGKPVENGIVFDDLLEETADEKQNYINFNARNFILGWLDGPAGITQLLILADGEETLEQAKERMRKNSSK